MTAERDVILDFIHNKWTGKLCTGYILIMTLTDIDDSTTTDEFALYCDPEQRTVVGIGLAEAASAALKARFVADVDDDD